MKHHLPFLSATLLLLASCTTAYKTGQTPDDVYFSPERQRDEYVRVREEDDRQYRADRRSDEEIREERFLRMRTRDRRYALLDDYDCYCYTGRNYDRFYDYYHRNNVVFRSNPWYWNRWSTWNGWNDPFYYNPYFNNPYFGGVAIVNGRPAVYNRPRKGNLAVYDTENNYNGNVPKRNGRTYTNSSTESDNYRGSGTNAGGFLRNVFGSSGSSSNGNSSSGSSNTSSSSSGGNKGSTSSGSSSSSSGSAPVRKF